MKSISKTQESNELLRQILIMPTDLSAIEHLLKEKNYNSDVISRAGFDYAEKCIDEADQYIFDHRKELQYSRAFLFPDRLSTYMPEVFELLLKYGLNPNSVCDEKTIMSRVSTVYNGYVAADTLALLLGYGGDPYLEVGDNDCLFVNIDFDVIFDALNMNHRFIHDAKVHCWFVLLGYSDNQYREKKLVTVFSERRSDCDLENFKLSDLRDHRNYTFGISNVPGSAGNWSLHIIDKRTSWEVARL